jgi:molybdate transport system substrate-binding protein
VMLAAGCGKGPSTNPQPGGATKKTVSVMVPCGQVGPFSEVADMFEKQNPGVTLDWMPENMVTIVQKIVDGKEKPDVFLSMGDHEVDLVEKAGLMLEGTRVSYADNALAITVPADNPGGVTDIKDFVKPSVKTIAVPDPKMNSVGVHGMEALHGAGIWDQVKDKVIQPQYAADGKEMGSKGQVDASIGYYPCVGEVHVKGEAPAKPKNIKVVGLVEPKYYHEFSCEGAVVKGCKDPEGGKQVLEMLKTPAAQEIFRKWSFTRTLQESGG